MILVYLLVGVLTGSVGFITTLLLGASFWSAFGVYALAGFASMTLLVGWQLLSGMIAEPRVLQDQPEPQGSAENILPFEKVPPSATRDVGHTAAMTILAVDDDAYILDVMTMIAANAGDFKVVTAGSGQGALELLSRSDLTFDYLLLDITMPDMDGIDLCRQIRQMPACRDVPIVMLTAMRGMDEMGEAFRAGATDYATKPFDVEDMTRRLQMAYQTFKTRVEASPVSHKTASGAVNPVALDTTRTDGERPDTLVDYQALLNYVTRLSAQDAKQVEMLSIKIDHVETTQARYTPARFAALLEDVATLAADHLGAGETVMAYTKDCDLVIATKSPDPLIINSLATLIEAYIQNDGVEETSIDKMRVTIGGPVKLQGQREQRARIAMDAAIALAENRALSKYKGELVSMSWGTTA